MCSLEGPLSSRVDMASAMYLVPRILEVRTPGPEFNRLPFISNQSSQGRQQKNKDPPAGRDSSRNAPRNPIAFQGSLDFQVQTHGAFLSFRVASDFKPKTYRDDSKIAKTHGRNAIQAETHPTNTEKQTPHGILSQMHGITAVLVQMRGPA